MSQVTPRKRRVSGAELGTRSSGRAKVKGAPAPNPPLVPFPTPPSSRHRSSRNPVPIPPRQPIFSPSSSDVLTSQETQPSKAAQAITLPPHLQTLLQLHNAFNLALSLYIATHPPVLPPHPPSATSVDLANLTTYVSIKETVERTSGRRFTTAELARLAWIWQWDGEALPEDRLTSERDKAKSKGKGEIDEDENPFLVSSSGPSSSAAPSTSSVKVSGLSYLITPTRTLDSNGRKTHTYGLGIELELKAGETRQILLGGNEGGLGNRGQGGGMAAIGRWNAGQEGREDVFRDRLEKWVELNGGYEPPVTEQSALPTPSTSDSARSSIPPIPLLSLPHLPQSTLLPSANLFSSPSKIDAAPGLTSLPKKLALDDPFVLDDGGKSKVVRTGSVEERRQAMMDRIKARSGKGSGPTLGSAVGKDNLDMIRPRLSAAEQHEALKKRSTLSRLEGIAEAVWMMFSAPSPGPSTLPTPPRGRRRAIPLGEVADVIVKSSKTPISLAEAQTSLQMLTELCPFFLTIKTVAKKEWLEMPSTLTASAGAPPSPGSSIASSRLAMITSSGGSGASPGSNASGRGVISPKAPISPTAVGRLPQEPGSPTPGSRSLAPSPSVWTGGMLSAAPAMPVSPSRTPIRQRTELVGPASPGRVRRQGGLREVREVIRRALGE